MAEAEHVLREKLAAVFARQDFYEACQRQDAGAMVAILDAGNVTQGQIAARTGIAQSTLSNKTGKFDEASSSPAPCSPACPRRKASGPR
jgi:hypothetical protein